MKLIKCQLKTKPSCLSNRDGISFRNKTWKHMNNTDEDMGVRK